MNPIMVVVAVVGAGVAGYACRGSEARVLKAIKAEVLKLEGEGVADVKAVLARIKKLF